MGSKKIYLKAKFTPFHPGTLVFRSSILSRNSSYFFNHHGRVVCFVTFLTDLLTCHKQFLYSIALAYSLFEYFSYMYESIVVFVNHHGRSCFYVWFLTVRLTFPKPYLYSIALAYSLFDYFSYMYQSIVVLSNHHGRSCFFITVVPSPPRNEIL